jgi:hypothetical protein
MGKKDTSTIAIASHRRRKNIHLQAETPNSDDLLLSYHQIDMGKKDTSTIAMASHRRRKKHSFAG